MCGSAPYLSLMTSTTQRPSSVLQGEEEGGNRGWTIAQLDSERDTHTHTHTHTHTQTHTHRHSAAHPCRSWPATVATPRLSTYNLNFWSSAAQQSKDRADTSSLHYFPHATMCTHTHTVGRTQTDPPTFTALIKEVLTVVCTEDKEKAAVGGEGGEKQSDHTAALKWQLS